MKTTKIMLAVFAVFILTWLTLAFIGYMLSEESTFREMCTSSPVIVIMLFVGWIPALIVGGDLDKEL